jgi:hypothetical protein
MQGIMYMAGLALFPAYKIYPKLAKILKWASLPIMAAGLVAGSFANTITQLIATQGVIYGIGGSIVYYPTLVWLDEWFVQKKGLAYGIMWAGTGAGRTDHSIHHELPAYILWFPDDSSCLGYCASVHLFTIDLLPSSKSPNIRRFSSSKTRAWFPSHLGLLVPHQWLHDLESWVFHLFHIPPHICSFTGA